MYEINYSRGKQLLYTECLCFLKINIYLILLKKNVFDSKFSFFPLFSLKILWLLIGFMFQASLAESMEVKVVFQKAQICQRCITKINLCSPRL